MKKDFDFDRVGKRLPYTVPDDFFAKLEDDIYNKAVIQKKRKAENRRPFMRVTLAALTTAAAAVILFFAIGGRYDAHSHVGFADVEQAFGNLSTEDQVYMLSVYQDDVFINE